MLLRETDGDRFLPIRIGPTEATAIAFSQMGVIPAQPLIHDLLCDLLRAANVRLLSVNITGVEGQQFFADLVLSNGRKVSARPSDSVALAVRTGAPVFGIVEVLDAAGISIPGESSQPAAADPVAAASIETTVDRHMSSLVRTVPLTPHLPSVELELTGVRVEMPSNHPIVLLKEKRGERYLPIWIGAMEATAIAIAQEGTIPPRPLSHDLGRELLAAVDTQLLSAEIAELKEGIFSVVLALSNGRRVLARPSDSIALAQRTGALILVSAAILDEVGVAIPAEESPPGRSKPSPSR